MSLKQSCTLRLYEPDECSKDGYPRAWHDFGADHELARWENGKRVKFGVKHLVREQAGHRCIRCAHPYPPGITKKCMRGQWTPCDAQCYVNDTHPSVGPTRTRWEYNGETGEGIEIIEAEYRILTVHHLLLGSDAKRDLRWWNLASLCQRCHLAIQGKVLMERVWAWEHKDWFKPHAAGWYAWTYLGEDLTREQTMARLPELLALERSVAA